MAGRTQQPLDDIRALLERRKEQLAQEIREVRASLAQGSHADLAGAVRDAGDDAVADILTHVDHAMVARDVAEMRDIDAALQRLAQGDFGSCIDCGTPIEPERIAAYPTAKRCFPCQVQHERTYKGARTPTL
jgi:DnaK suppressor protein